MLLSKAELALATLSSKEHSRYTLQGIFVEAEKTVETDGYQLVTVSHEEHAKETDSYPQTEGLTHFTPNGTGVLISRNAATAALKALPKKSTLPVLQKAALGEDAMLFVNNLDSVQTFEGKMEGQFPKWEAVIPTQKIQAEICFDPKKMLALMKYLAEHTDSLKPYVRLTVYAAETALRIDARTEDGQDITVLLMPCRANNEDFPKRPTELKNEQVNQEQEKQEHGQS